jgi:hypothetical protein
MYTYIYTEKPMNFYRTGKVIGVTANTALNLEGPQFKHKAVMFPNGSFTGTPLIFINLYDSNNPSPLGVTLGIQASTTGQTPYIFPGILRSITPNTTGRIVLLN